MFAIDLKSGYHHIGIVSRHNTYLGFAWMSECYVLTVRPFGLSSAPYAFYYVNASFGALVAEKRSENCCIFR